MTVRIGSTWLSYEGNAFRVDDIVTNETGTWVYYHLLGSNKHYNCLMDAFQSRFREDLTVKYGTY